MGACFFCWNFLDEGFVGVGNFLGMGGNGREGNVFEEFGVVLKDLGGFCLIKEVGPLACRGRR